MGFKSDLRAGFTNTSSFMPPEWVAAGMMKRSLVLLGPQRVIPRLAGIQTHRLAVPMLMTMEMMVPEKLTESSCSEKRRPG